MSDFLAGRVLIAMPGIGDPRFERAVILMCAHTAEHAMGLALNRPIDGLTAGDVFDRLELSPGDSTPLEPVLLGGPVQAERGFVLHTDDYVCADATLTVCDGVGLTATRDVLEAMIDPERKPRRALLALGYAGWGAGQLEREIQESVWLISDPDEALLFDHDYDRKWSAALAKIGVSAGRLAGSGGTA